MKLKLSVISILIGSACITNITFANDSKVFNPHQNSGTYSFLADKLDKNTNSKATAALKSVLQQHHAYQLFGNENFTIKKEWADELGIHHTRLAQTINGLKVYGTSITLHKNIKLTSNRTNNAVENSYTISGKLAVNKESSALELINKSTKQMSKKLKSAQQAIHSASIEGKVITDPELVYIYLPLIDETKLAWKIEVTWSGNGEFGHDILFYDHESLALLTRHAQVHSAKSRQTYDMNKQEPKQGGGSGTLKCIDSQSCGDASAQRAHDGASGVYDFYKAKFNRDGINSSGMTMKSSVHIGDENGNNVANAYWWLDQMWYGDGDGQTLGDLTLSYDVIGHELTHGVIQYSANLAYKNGSGALNEAWADIMGAAANAYSNGSNQPDWLLAEESYTPNTPGDAMRYMNNPTKDGHSKDWWPERVPYESSPDRYNDYGGVHSNSGIANLAFALLTDGGIHPRNKSTAQVPSIGLSKAEQIFYRALTTYMNENSDFAAARTATARAAQDLYGATEKLAVETAWCAVGVGTCPDPIDDPVDDDPVDDDPIKLDNGITKTGISGAEKSNAYFTLQVPAGATNLVFNTAGRDSSGDADLYVKFGALPVVDEATNVCGNAATSNETCTINNIQAGTYYVLVHAWKAISNVSLTGSYTPPSNGGLEPITEIKENNYAWQGQTFHHDIVIPEGYSRFDVTLTGGYGDMDLYLFSPGSTTPVCQSVNWGNNEVCRIGNPRAGNWHIDTYGKQTSSGVTLKMEAY